MLVFWFGKKKRCVVNDRELYIMNAFCNHVMSHNTFYKILIQLHKRPFGCNGVACT